MTGILTHLRNKLLAGALSVIPLVIVVYIALFLEEHTKVLEAPLGIRFPGLGVVIAVLGIYVLGLVVTSFLGQIVLGWLNTLLLKVPGLNLVYRAWKDILVAPPDKTGMFHQAVLVHTGVGQAQLGFTNGGPLPGDPESICVLLPNIPSPFSGRLLVVRRDACVFLNLSVEDALKYQLSTGTFVPPGLVMKS
ncbi:MAG: DUF502 domain-containing protein [Gemmataceae bacterium]